MIPAIAVLIGSYAIARLIQVFMEHGTSEDKHKSIQLVSIIGILIIAVCVAIVLTNGMAAADALKALMPSTPK